ncbi:MAG: serine/threonine-protein phosphatase [Treponema sp.]|nr:serine/threonine-protein phosphatase [Treponema sp.]
MYKTKRRAALIVVNLVAAVIFITLAISLAPQTKINDYRIYSNFFPIIVTAILFIILSFASVSIYTSYTEKLEKKTMESGATAYFTEFVEKLRFCYSLEDFYRIIAEILEMRADCSVFYVESVTNYTFYNSPNRLVAGTFNQNRSEMLNTLIENFDGDWPDGIFFFDENCGLVTKSKFARGVLFSNCGEHFFIFCRYMYLFDPEIFPKIFEEFVRFQNRSRIIKDLSEISDLSREWAQLADTQRSFLPAKLPEVERVKFAAYFRPLINVSGDYYTVLPIDEHKTFVMLGDVSGKGMAAALVMGLVMNTVKIREDKEDLVGTIHAIDESIKSMHLQDKYTVLFMGVIDTEKMRIRYINASMSDPIIITKSPEGYRIKPLSSNCSIVGIIPLDDDIPIAEQRLFSGDMILMASDGVSEVMNEEKIELGDTQLYTDTIKASAGKSPDEFINDIANLVMDYNGDARLHDDVTMLAAKIGPTKK